MRLSLAIAFLTVSTTGAFAPAWGVTRSQVRSFLSTVEADAEVAAKESQQSAAAAAAAAAPSGPLTGAEINARLEAQLEKLREKDATSPLLSKAVRECSLCSIRFLRCYCSDVSRSSIR